MSSLNTTDVDELIANGRRLVQEANDAIKKTDQYFAEHNIDPQEVRNEVRRTGGEAAIQALEAELKAVTQQIEDECERDRIHGARPRASGNRLRIRNASV